MVNNLKIIFLPFLAILFIALPIGCDSGDSKKDNASADREALLTQKGLFGQWEMIISQSKTELHPFLFTFEEQKNIPIPLIKLTDTITNFSSWVLDSSEVMEPVITLNLQQGGSIVTFKGTKRQRGIFGAIAFPDGRVFPARLERTTNVNLDEMEDAIPYPNYDDYKAAFSGKGAFANLKAFVEKNPESALALNASREMIARAGIQGLSNEETKKLIDDYVALATTWDRLLVPKVYTEVVQTLVNFEFPPELVKSVVEDTKKFPDGFIHKNFADTIKYDSGLAFLKSDDPKLQEEGSEIYNSMLEDTPYSPDLLIFLAQYEEKTGKTKAALERYAQLKILPGLEQIAYQISTQLDLKVDLDTTLQDLFKKVKPDGAKNLDAYLDQVYHGAMKEFYKEDIEYPSESENQQVVLCELFTGAACPPCVAADLATVALEKQLPKSQFITLRYHQHIPAPDPLANPIVESRFNFYPARGGSKGTPTVIINGQFGPGQVAGALPQTNMAISSLRTAVTSELEKESEIDIVLDLKVDGNVIKISGNVKNLPEDRDDLKLRLALAEDVVKFDAPNGIREHEMIVREMPGGIEGFPISAKSSEFEQKVDVGFLRKLIANSLEQFEMNAQTRFKVKPIELNQLHVVAFVQDDKFSEEKGLEVLQAKAMKVPAVFNASDSKAKTETKKKETAKPEASKMKKVEKKEEPANKKSDDSKKEPSKAKSETKIPPAPKKPATVEK